ncbi:hypothetical protein V8C34DRAFT_294470 [Trichoderma compactum]
MSRNLTRGGQVISSNACKPIRADMPVTTQCGLDHPRPMIPCMSMSMSMSILRAYIDLYHSNHRLLGRSKHRPFRQTYSLSKLQVPSYPTKEIQSGKRREKK